MLTVSGHVEATEVRVAGQVGGRLVELRAAERDRVAAGDVVGVLDTRDVELEIRSHLLSLDSGRAAAAAADDAIRAAVEVRRVVLRFSSCDGWDGSRHRDALSSTEVERDLAPVSVALVG